MKKLVVPTTLLLIVLSWVMLMSRMVDLKAMMLFINSDMATLASIYYDVVGAVYDLRGWKLPQSPYFFPDTLAYFATMQVVKNTLHATYLYGLAQVILTAFVFSKIYQQITKQTFTLSFLKLGSLTIIFVNLLSIFLKKFDGLFSFMLMHSFHYSAFLVTIYCVYLVLRYLETRKNIYLFVLIILSALTAISDRFFILMFIAPMLGSIGLYKFDIRKLFKNAWKNISLITSLIFILIGSMAVTSFMIYKGWMVGNPESRIGISEGIANINEGMDVSYVQIFLITFVLNLLIALRCMFVRKFNDAYLIFSILNSLILMSAVIVLGLYVDLGSMRYICSISFLFIFNLPIYYFFNKNFVPEVISKNIKYFAVFLVAVTFAVNLYFIDFNLRVGELINYIPSRTQCILDKQKTLGLKGGFAQYWDAKNHTEISGRELFIVQLNQDFSIRNFVNNLYWYDVSVNDMKYNFILVDHNYNPDITFNKNFVVAKFGKPDLIENCVDMDIYFYKDENILTDILKAQYEELRSGNDEL